MTAPVPVVEARDVAKAFARKGSAPVTALSAITLSAMPGTITALVGPDGAGKTTLLRLTAGLMAIDGGSLSVFGQAVGDDPQAVQDRIGYMPQKFGLYEDLTVQENLDLYADLHGIARAERSAIYGRLMDMTDLGRFTARPAGKLSGGMKQKLGLACTLVRAPELLLLDEPTVGVDPLSRRELWAIVLKLVREGGVTVIVATSYLDEAQFCDQAVVLHEGAILAKGAPAEIAATAAGRVFRVPVPAEITAPKLQAAAVTPGSVVDCVPEAGALRIVTRDAGPPALVHGGQAIKATPAEPRFEDAFMILFDAVTGGHRRTAIELARDRVASGDASVTTSRLVKRFGAFTAVDAVSFTVSPGQIFGLLGPNGAGKSTTFRMLCGLIPASDGTLKVAGEDLRRARASARARLGYVAQKFSLYGGLTVDENLDFFGRAYGLGPRLRRQRIAWAKAQFELDDVGSVASGALPGGYKQRLAMAAALLHQPEILFLDEATSGADPKARREFWERIEALSAQGVTVIVTTHFMDEAEYCDRIIIMDGGRDLAQGTPDEIRARAPSRGGQPATMEEAFIAIIEANRAARDSETGGGKAA